MQAYDVEQVLSTIKTQEWLLLNMEFLHFEPHREQDTTILTSAFSNTINFNCFSGVIINIIVYSLNIPFVLPISSARDASPSKLINSSSSVISEFAVGSLNSLLSPRCWISAFDSPQSAYDQLPFFDFEYRQENETNEPTLCVLQKEVGDE